MSEHSDWTLSSIADLPKWLFEGLFNFHNKASFSDRKYALFPVELDDQDYVSLQIVRQVRTFDRAALPRLADANEQAIAMWRPGYGLGPLLDMLGIAQQLGCRDLRGHIVELTLPLTLNCLLKSDRQRLLSALVDVLISDKDFRFGRPLYSLLRRIVTPHHSLFAASLSQATGSGEVSERTLPTVEPYKADYKPLESPLPALMLARALRALVARSHEHWREILRDYYREFDAFANPAESPLGIVFFEIERNFPTSYFAHLFLGGSEQVLRMDESWIVRWFFLSRNTRSSFLAPLRLRNAQEDFYIGFASRPNDEIPLNKAKMPYFAHEELLRLVVDASGVTRIGEGEPPEAASVEVGIEELLSNKLVPFASVKQKNSR